MKRLILPFLLFFLFSNFIHAYEVSGFAVDSETGDGLPSIKLYLLTESGLVKFTDTGNDGSFTFTNVQNGSHELEFHYYEPVIINGVYYLRQLYGDTIEVNGQSVNDIVFEIDPHHPVYQVRGTLYDASTNQPITGHNMSLRLDFFSHSGFFYAWSDIDGTYEFEDPVPDWSYYFDAFQNAYYYGDQIELTIDTTSPQEIVIDFFLEPKSGTTVSGQLFDVETGAPIEIANRTVRITAINPYWAETNENGEFTFVNVDPGYYANIKVTSEDTAYINCPESVLYDITVPEEGLDGVELFQKKFVTVHEVTADENSFIPGEIKTVRFSLVHEDQTYGEIWGVELHISENMTVLNKGPFYSYEDGDVVFEIKDFCTTDDRLVWEGYHSVFGIGNVGNLQGLNDSVYTDVEIQFFEYLPDQDAEVFYEVFYSYACAWQPFSFGTLHFENNSTSVGIQETSHRSNSIAVSPNPASDQITVQLTLNKAGSGKIIIYDNIGHAVIKPDKKNFIKGENKIRIETGKLSEGLYFYTFSNESLALSGKLVIAR